MLEVQDSLKNSVWSRFVQEGVLDKSRINKRISESWYICRQDGVNPYNGKGNELLQENQFLRRKNASSQLLNAALPFIRKLQKFFGQMKSLFLLVDSDGYVLYMDGDPMALEKAGAINFIEGVKWTEKEVGTNAVGTALRTKEPIAVIGAEHYAVASHSWGCAASPILSENGQMEGVLNISYPLEYGVHEHMLPSVVSAAYAIEQKLINIAKDKELELMQYASFINPQDPLSLVCNEKEKIIWASNHLKNELSNLNAAYLSDVLNEGCTVLEKQPVYSRTRNDVIGFKISLKKTESTNMAKRFPVNPAFQFGGVCGESKKFRKVLFQAERAAKSNITIHIHGETGTGKEVMARSIHLNSTRKHGPFIAVNCGSLPKDLIASELFGYAGGAFTGAKREGHKGKFQQANGGTLFLDEVAEIPQEMQVALLRVLEEKEVVPIGGTKPFPVDVRIITATHRDLAELAAKGDVREDFFYRIFVYPIQLPPLRERMEDIPYFVRHYCRTNNWQVTFSRDLLECLQTYEWHGNIRELHNFLDRLRIEFETMPPTLAEMKTLLHSDIRPLSHSVALPLNEDLTYREQIEKAKMMDALLAAEGNVTKAAEKLNISRSTLYRKIKKFHL
ncbi:sigma-54-dependent Fis family transcriptional regulator [Siminovitchia fortis]|uniref:sigma-54-dependent Fis family transcriptional regulator n=1 Tax=Siminovitchia fortis TaxID=254758 RepID=UPI001ABF8680|nr:sigma-54-dependent Fis family transcriptional regulator [Siminovitchia fortis]WHY80341.1 sigma-54-dependent Fis family transcriptional regulator [Siminovitchia fortis]